MAIRHVKQADTTEIAYSLDEDVTCPPGMPPGWYPTSKFKAVGDGANVIEVGALTPEQQAICADVRSSRGESAASYEWCRHGIRAVRHPRGHMVRQPAYIAGWVAETPPDETMYLWMYLTSITVGLDPEKMFGELGGGDPGNGEGPSTSGGTTSAGDDTPAT